MTLHYRFEDMLRGLQPDRTPVAEAMVWCIEHADAGEEIIECIAESLSILEVGWPITLLCLAKLGLTVLVF